ncbi:hypothetical protein GH714_019850 [Hevea brasiliensis]|uniref:Uncharacterized protein n=1 Tax=Hevea brasiliensis TaxID=3981 RepID=A0A6A6LC92_HEVBR|nr:hypothetical protein GH714_019850 [Hevea brasiliensis]
MMKLSRLLQQSRDASRLHALTFQAGISTARQDLTANERIYAPYCVFKGKAALSVEPVPPTFTKLNSGNVRVERRGIMMLTFMPAIGERKYDYEKRQHFALSATEVGSLISLGPKDSSEFFHDPSMLSRNASHFEGVVNNILRTNERFNVPLTAGEFAVLKTACSFALPHIMGWDRLTAKLPKESVGSPSKANRQEPDIEWAK